MRITLTGLPDDLLAMVVFLQQHMTIITVREYPTPGDETRTLTVDLVARIRDLKS